MCRKVNHFPRCDVRRKGLCGVRLAAGLFLFVLFWNRDAFGSEIAFDGVEGKVFHPALVNVVFHRDPKAFQIGMPIDEGSHGLGLDVLFGFGLDGDDALFGLDGEVNLHL